MAAKSLKLILKNNAQGLFYFIRPYYREARRLYWTNRFRGKGVYCPCCEKEYSKFCDSKDELINFYPPKIGVSVLCPNCQSLNRHRILCDFFSKNNIFENLKKKDVLLFAPEYSIMRWLKNHKIPFTTADLFERDVELNLDLMNIALESSSVHVIICNHVLEHVLDYNKCLGELYRVLDSNGVCFLSVPILEDHATTYEDPSITTETEREKHFGQSDHLRVFGADFIKILENKGFFVEVIDGKNTDEHIRANFNGPCIYDSTKVFLCRKQSSN